MDSETRTSVLGLKMSRFQLVTSSCLLTFLATGTAAYVQLHDAVSTEAIEVSQLPYYNSREFTPHWFAPDSRALSDFHAIPDFSFTNQEGQLITEENVAGRLYVANFFFSTCPGICPMIRSKVSWVEERFIDDQGVVILSHSIRPSTDTEEVLQAYAETYGVVSGKWHLLTGQRESIYALAKSAYFADEDLGDVRNSTDFLHTENLLLIDHNRHIRGVYNGLSASSVQELISDIELLQAEMRQQSSST